MDATIPQLAIENNLYLYGYGLNTGLLVTTCIYMSLLAIYYKQQKNLHAYKLFVYNIVCNILFIFFDIFCISMHSPEISQFFPQAIITIGSFIMPLALLLAFHMFVKAIPIKTVAAFLFWDSSQRFYPFIQLLFIISFVALLLINNPVFSFSISFILIAVMSIIEYIIANNTLNLTRYQSLQKIIFIGLITCSIITVVVSLAIGFSIELQPIWMAIRSIIGVMVVVFSFIISRFIVQESFYIVESSTISGEDFFKEIYNAAKHHHFFIEYQPKIYLEGQEISGAEALVRWQHPKHGLIPPNDFIPLAEKTDLINQICKWVIVRVVRDIKDMEYINIHLPISINFSVKNLHTEMVTFLINTLEKYEVSTGMIIVEITETMFLDMHDGQKAALQMLRDADIRLSMDDFGAGHSSFAYFDEIGLNELKLDRKISNNILLPNKDKVIATIIDLCHSLDIKVVAEGIEDEDIQEKLFSMRCNYAQGFGICRPKRLADFIDWVRFDHENLERKELRKERELENIHNT